MRRRLEIAFCLLLAVFCSWMSEPVQAAETSGPGLQQLIDNTPAGETLRLPAGTYQGAVTITRPMTIQADGEVHIVNASGKPAVYVQAAQVRLQSLTITQEFENNPAVLVTGSSATLDGLDIRTRSFGIVLRDTADNEIRNSRVIWLEDESRDPVKLSEKLNGIDLYNAHRNRIQDNVVSGMHDGIYLESSHQNTVEHNRVDYSRYGVHCMYTDGTVIRANTGSFNVTGAMIMGVKDAEVTGNSFYKQSESVNSQGLLLFDVQTSSIADNKVQGNRVGLYIEQSRRNELRNNEVIQNFVGIQLLESEENRFTGNRFSGNVIEAEATDSRDNRLEGNYWDSFRGIDTTGDGFSDLPYLMNPFFQKLTKATPAFQLFFQSPGMQFLESMNTAGKSEWTMDTAPLMRPEEAGGAATEQSGQAGMLMLGIFLLLLSWTTIYFTGGKKT
ncbi:right-handed parallel beta-helix repeat-containing protein [Paenibacillus sp. y28]|uniref:right-handed parallel beta-helix repeat-containing protein n=1 Tax=Paenibacillus sp. y28 TaxID=3129110 RepID=UPI003018AB77